MAVWLIIMLIVLVVLLSVGIAEDNWLILLFFLWLIVTGIGAFVVQLFKRCVPSPSYLCEQLASFDVHKQMVDSLARAVANVNKHLLNRSYFLGVIPHHDSVPQNGGTRLEPCEGGGPGDAELPRDLHPLHLPQEDGLLCQPLPVGRIQRSRSNNAASFQATIASAIREAENRIIKEDKDIVRPSLAFI